jgi:hypothetical protein
VYRVLVGKPGGKSHWEDPGVDGRIILRWVVNNWEMELWTGLGWPRIEVASGHL